MAELPLKGLRVLVVEDQYYLATDICEWLREAGAQKLAENEVPFLFATGYDRSIIPAEYRDHPRIEKPFKGPDVISAVEALWRQSSNAGASAGSKTTGGAFQT